MKKGSIIRTFFLLLTNAVFAQPRIAAQVNIGSASPLVSRTVITIHKLDKTLNIYPNPARSRLYVQIAETATLSLINENSKTVIQQVIQNSGSINVQRVPAGLYYLKNNTTDDTKKVIITK